MHKRFGVFEALKYGIYLLLAMDLWVFFQDEWLATAHLRGGGVAAIDWVSAFAATIDTAAWLVLLVLFELETSLLRAREVNARWMLVIQTLTGICYLLIVASFWGYASKVSLLAGFAASSADACSLAGTGASLAVDLDEYVSFAAAQCRELAGVALLKLPGLAIYATEQAALAQQRLAWVDLINAGAWLGVVAVLAFDVFLAQRHRLLGGLLRISWSLKAILYLTLVVAAIYWIVRGGFVDALDAVLWLLAFAFIELNLFGWSAAEGNNSEGLPDSEPGA